MKVSTERNQDNTVTEQYPYTVGAKLFKEGPYREEAQ
jgi:hypothetical protein